jgi:hypothetical protein
MSNAGRRQPKHVVIVGPHGKGWFISVDDFAGMLMEGTTKFVAISVARGIARELKAELVIKGKSGRILERDSFGHDPRSRKG